MLRLFQRHRPETHRPPAEPVDGWEHPKPATILLSTPRREKLLEYIWQRTSLSRRQFTALYKGPLERYAELVQLLPASESHHHAYDGGMLDHGLEVVAYALKLRQLHLLPIGSPPEDQAAQAEAWTAATAYAALLHDIGKIAVDVQVEHADGSTWHPWHGPLSQAYRFRYRANREYRLHSAATGLLYNQVLDQPIFNWLSMYPELWSALLYVLAGQYEHAGVLGELVIKADRASVAQELGGDPAKAVAAPKHVLQRKLLEGLRYLIKKELKLNQSGPSDGWLTDDALWLVSKTVSDKLRAHLLAQGIDGIPANNTAVFNVLQDHGMLQTTSEGTAIWRATVASETGWCHAFTLLRMAPALIWDSAERPYSFSGTVTPETVARAVGAVGMGNTQTRSDTTILNEVDMAMVATSGTTTGTTIYAPDVMEDLLSMMEMGISAEAQNPQQLTQSAQSETVKTAQLISCQPAPIDGAPYLSRQPSGEHFLDWLKQGMESHRILINDAKALVHTVADTVYLVSPGVFQRYAQEHTDIGSLARQAKLQDWKWVQKDFERLQQHRKHPDGRNIWTCEVTGPRRSRRLHGYLLLDPLVVLSKLVPNNPYLTIDA